ncbi:hypothetical protein GCM10007863_29360 [Dyella mobilis]|nr:hypothetical protein GCM10007863_29360 [Dyella mobilis]
MAGEPAAMGYYDQVQQARDEARAYIVAPHPGQQGLQQAVSILKRALQTLDQPNVMGLADGNDYLRSRRADVLRDLAAAYALQGNRSAALDALEAAQSEALYPVLASYYRQEKAFASLQNEPRFQAMLANLDQAGRLWQAKSLTGPYTPQLDEVHRIAGLSLFWSEAKYNFVHFDHVPQLDWDQVYLDFLPQVIAAKDTKAYYEVLMRLAPLLHDGHTNIYPPEALQSHFYARPPLVTGLFENRVLVTGVFSPALATKGLRVGDEITAIDGMEVHRYAQERVAPYASIATPQDGEVRMYDYGLLDGDADQPVTLTIRNAQGASRDVTLARKGYDEKWPTRFAFRMLPGSIAYLVLSHFESDAAVKAFEQHLPQIMQAKGLILDVRGNGGGNSDYGMRILSYLSERPIPFLRERVLSVSPYWRMQGQTMLEWRRLPDSGVPYVHSEPVHFSGPVAVLTGPRSFSAAEDFVASFKAMHRGLLVGRPTAGSTGQPLMFDLPGGGKARICVKRETSPDGEPFVGIGIAPDIQVITTVADIRAGRDPVLERAEQALENVDQADHGQDHQHEDHHENGKQHFGDGAGDAGQGAEAQPAGGQ